MGEKKFQYYAFISYSRKDSADAEWFHSGLEKIHIPAKLPRTENSEPLPRRLRLFRDKTDLPVRSESFSADLQRSIADSRYLIVEKLTKMYRLKKVFFVLS